jgi:hypothetical protein
MLFPTWRFTVKQRNSGPAIGTYLGRPIFATIQRDGQRYVFDRIAEGDTEGYPLTQLKKDEVLMMPGIIYRRAS